MERKISYIIIAVILGILVIANLGLFTNGTQLNEDKAQLSQQSFDGLFSVSYSPENPEHNETVEITLTSTTSENISDAHLIFSYKTEEMDDFSDSGGVDSDYQFTYGSNKTVMRGWIPKQWNQGGWTIKFWVNATIDGTEWYRSDAYTYTVQKTGGWTSDEFSDNLGLDFEPKGPKSNESVEITVSKTSEDIVVNNVNLIATIQQPDSSPQEGGSAFEKDNGEWTTTIPAYPENTSVSFHVAAFDTYGERIQSQNYSYTVGRGAQFVKPLIVVFDELNNEYVDKATVRVENSSGVVFEGTTDNGKVQVSTPLSPGEYTLTTIYSGEEKSKSIQLTGMESGEEATFRFDISPKSTLEHDNIAFPQNYLIAGVFGAVFVPLVCLWSVYKKKHEKRMALTEEDTNIEDLNKGTLTGKIWEAIINETMDPEYIIPAGFFLLSIFGLAFIPFYPWWMVLTLSIVVGAVAYKYPYNALIILALLVTGAAAYQTPEFGLVFLVFSLIVVLASFFDWRFGYLVFSIIFLARFGAVFFVPVMSVVLFSTYLALISTAAAGLFLVLASSTSNLEVLGLVTSAPHDTSFMLFSKNVVSDFTPGALGGALASISSARGNIITTVIADNFGASIIPFFQILLWCVGVYLVSLIIEARQPRLEKLMDWLKYPLKKDWWYSVAGSLVLGLSSLPGLVYFGYLDGLEPLGLLVAVGVIVGSVILAFVSQGLGAMTKGLFKEYYRSKLGITDVGTRVAEMADLGETTFENIGGLDDVKEEVKESILIPLLRPDISDKFGVETSKGVLLYGPPGCGKTMLMKALATELDVEMINVKCGDVMSRWYGESEDKMMTLFKAARERKPCIIFFDEIDAIAKKRDMYSADDVTPRLLSLLLSELDGMDRAEGIIMVGSTNKPDMVDPALLRPGRFDKIIYVPPPEKEARKEILDIHLSGKPLSSDVDMDALARKTEGFSGADMANLAKEAATQAMRSAIDTGDMKPIHKGTFNKVLKQMSPSITPSMKEEYERVKSKYERKVHEAKKPEMDRGTTLDDVPDLQEQKNVLKNQVLYPLTESDMVEKFNISGVKNVLFYGPKGCDKETLIKAAANDVGIPMRVLSARELKEAIDEEGRGVVKKLFKEVRDMAPAVITVTELEEIAGVDISGIAGPKAFSSLLNLMEDVNGVDNVALVATSHYPDKIKDILFERGRFEKTIRVPPPDDERKEALLRKGLEGVPTHPDIDYHDLAILTEDFTSDDIKSCVEEAKIRAISEGSEGKAKRITQDLLEEVIMETTPSLKEEMVESAEEFEEERG